MRQPDLARQSILAAALDLSGIRPWQEASCCHSSKPGMDVIKPSDNLERDSVVKLRLGAVARSGNTNIASV